MAHILQTNTSPCYKCNMNLKPCRQVELTSLSGVGVLMPSNKVQIWMAYWHKPFRENLEKGRSGTRSPKCHKIASWNRKGTILWLVHGRITKVQDQVQPIECITLVSKRLVLTAKGHLDIWGRCKCKEDTLEKKIWWKG